MLRNAAAEVQVIWTSKNGTGWLIRIYEVKKIHLVVVYLQWVIPCLQEGCFLLTLSFVQLEDLQFREDNRLCLGNL